MKLNQASYNQSSINFGLLGTNHPYLHRASSGSKLKTLKTSFDQKKERSAQTRQMKEKAREFKEMIKKEKQEERKRQEQRKKAKEESEKKNLVVQQVDICGLNWMRWDGMGWDGGMVVD